VSAAHITPSRLVDLSMAIADSNLGNAALTTADVKALIATVRAYWALTHNLAALSERGAVVSLSSGDEVELSEDAIENHESNYAERCEEAANEAYYGGDAPGSYGPSDPRGAA
jgi:hypothetical protein